MIYRELLSYIYSVLYANYLCSQWSSKQRIRLNFSVLSPFQCFIPISAFYLHFSVLSPFQFPLSVSVSAIPFQRFIPTHPTRHPLPANVKEVLTWGISLLSPFSIVLLNLKYIMALILTNLLLERVLSFLRKIILTISVRHLTLKPEST